MHANAQLAYMLGVAARYEAAGEANARLAAEAENLERYRSNFFGELRGMLEGEEGVRIAGDRFGFGNYLVSSGGSHTVGYCNSRVLVRCP